MTRNSLIKRILTIFFSILVFSSIVLTYGYVFSLLGNRSQFSQFFFKQFLNHESDNVAIKYPTIKLDTIPPEITVITPQNEVFSKNSILKITVKEKNLNPVITINNKIFQTDNTGFLIYPFEVKDGKNTFVIKAMSKYHAEYFLAILS